MDNTEINQIKKQLEKIWFFSNINSELGGLELQRTRILTEPIDPTLFVSPVHDVDFYLILLRRLYRYVENTATYDPRVANLKGKNKKLVINIKMRDHLEHGVDFTKLPIADISETPQISSAIYGTNLKISTSLFTGNGSAMIVSGNWKWDLYSDHELFCKMIRDFINFYPFKEKQKDKT